MQKNQNSKTKPSVGSNSIWKRKKTYALMIAISSAMYGHAYAQEATDTPTLTAQEKEALEKNTNEIPAEEEIIEVRGMRGAIMTATDLKRNSGTIIDSITATDIGAFPDKSVAEALQRVAGVSVSRFAGPTDTAHFSAEPTGVLVRGLSQVRSEFNGRDSFSANSSRGLSWGDISPELMAGVDTYKNQMAELIEGGISGSVNMRTRVPFDQQDEMFALTVGANYGDLAEKVTPDVSGLYSNRWKTDSGEWGLMANLAYSNVQTRSQGNQLGKFVPYSGFDELDDGNRVWIPTGISMRDNIYDRTRTGGSVAFQWKNLEETVLVTGQYNRSEYENTWAEHVVITAIGNDPGQGNSIFYEYTPENLSFLTPAQAPGSAPFTFDNSGVFQGGTINRETGWWGSNNAASADRGSIAPGIPVVDIDANIGSRGTDITTESRSSKGTNKTEDYSLNLKWKITDSIRSNFDLQYVDASVESWDITTGFGFFADAEIDFSDNFKVNLLPPTSINMTQGGYEDPHNYRLNHMMDHFEDSYGNELAFKADFEFDVFGKHIKSVKVGARYADRDQVVRATNYNWESIATTWSSNQVDFYNIDNHEATPDSAFQPDFQGYPEGYYELHDFNQDYLGLSTAGGSTKFYFADTDYLANRKLTESTLGSPALGLVGGAGWEPACSGLGDRAGLLDGQCVTPAEYVDISEETYAFYTQLDLEGELFGFNYSGNIGVRYVRTENVSSGGAAFTNLSDDYLWTETDSIELRGAAIPGGGYLKCEYPEVEEGQDPREIPGTMGCYINPQDAGFLNADDQLNVVTKIHHHILPSINLKFEINDELETRFGLSKAMSRPDIGNLRNFVRVSGNLPDINNASDPKWTKNASGEVVEAQIDYSGGANNPYLKPITAIQADVTLEWYFDEDGSLTTAIFYKAFDDYIQTGKFQRTLVSNGVEKTVVVQGPINGDGAKITGLEVAFTNFFDSLPDPFDGFGMQANYTFLKNKGIETSTASSGTLSGGLESSSASDFVDVDALQGLSDHTFNVVGMYEKGPWSLRLAYNWRSEYMVTSLDCCVGRPMWQDAYGQLDGSIQYRVNDNLTVSLKASNMTNEETVLSQQVQNASGEGGLEGVKAGRTIGSSWFQNDRRYVVTANLRF